MIAAQRWRMILTYLCSGFIVLAVSCKDTRDAHEGQGKPTAPVPISGGTYHQAIWQEPLMLDPAFLTDIYATPVALQIFDGLVQFDANLNVIPCIAKS